jgi:hypothetical protein
MSLPVNLPLDLTPTQVISHYHDRKLPHLSALLDTDYMAIPLMKLLRTAFSANLRLIHCQQKRIKYKPHKNCLVIYVFHTHDLASGKQQKTTISCRTYEHNGSKRRYHKALKENDGEPSAFPRVFHLPALEVVGWIFPCERKVLSLPFVSHQHYLKHVLMPTVVKQAWGTQWRIDELSSVVMHYVPEHTCMVKVTCTLISNTTHTSCHKTLFAKCYYNDEGERTFDIMAQLAKVASAGKTALQFPAPLYYDPQRKILWQEGLNGQTLRDAGISRQPHSALLPIAAKAMAQFHQLSIDFPPSSTIPQDSQHVLTLLQQRQHVLRPIQQIDQKKITASGSFTAS